MRYRTTQHDHLLALCQSVDNLFSYGRTNFIGTGRATSILNLGYKNTNETVRISDTAEQICDPLLEDYRTVFGIQKLQPETRWLALRYGQGDFFDTHTDDISDIRRTVSAVIYLNKTYVGGEVSFPVFGVSLVPEPGDVLIFPSSYPYAHKVSTILEGTKYSLVNWYTI